MVQQETIPHRIATVDVARTLVSAGSRLVSTLLVGHASAGPGECNSPAHHLFLAQCTDRIDACGATSWKPCGSQRDSEQQGGCGSQTPRVARVHLKEHGGQQPR